MKTKQTSRWTLIGLLLVFVLPMILAWYLYQHPGLLKGHTNHGQLLKPPLQFNQLSLEEFDSQSLKGKWLILYLDELPCALNCQKNLYKMRQVRTALGKESGRVGRLLVLMGSPQALDSLLRERLDKDYVGMQIAFISQTVRQDFFQKGAAASGFYLIDPLGNIMLSYPKDVPPEHLFKDLQHLLRISQIG